MGKDQLASPMDQSYNFDMNAETHELIRICQQLPEAEQHEVVDFARDLLSRQWPHSEKGVSVEHWLSTARSRA